MHMKRNKYRDYLWYTTLVVFAICVIEGIMYYHDVENTFLKATLNIQNAIKAYKIDPDIEQGQALEYLAESGGGIIKTFITYLYCIAVIIAPLCTVGAVTLLVRRPVSYVKGIFSQRKKKRILVIGEGGYQEKFVNALSDDCRVTVVENDDLSDSLKLKYLNNGVKIKQHYKDMPVKELLKLLDMNKYEEILLCDENVTENINIFKAIITIYNNKQNENDKAFYKQIYLCSNDTAISELVKQYYDGLDSKCFDLNIIDINEMAVNRMFKEYPVYLGNDKDNCDVHLAVIGFGEFGQKTLIQALNMAVLSADSKIYIDAYDLNMQEIISTFMNNFSVDISDGLKCVKADIYEGEEIKYYELDFSDKNLKEKFGMDGELKLRFWNCDIRTLQFNKILRECNKEFAYTYIVIAMGSTNLIANTVNGINQYLCRDDSNKKRIPVVIRIKEDIDFIDLYNDDNIYILDQNENVYSYSGLTNSDVVDEAKLFNARYNKLYEILSGYKEKKIDDKFMLNIEQNLKGYENSDECFKDSNASWHKMSVFNRESSIAQSLHQQMKEWIVIKKHIYEFADRENLEKLEHRRWTIFMISHGFRYGEEKNNVAKTHPCILTWEELKKKKPETLEYDYTPYYILKAEQFNEKN